MSLSGGPLAQGSPDLTDRVPLLGDGPTVLGFWDDQTALLADNQLGYLQLTVRSLNPESFGGVEYSQPVPGVDNNEALQFVPIDDFVGLIVSYSEGGRLDDTLPYYSMDIAVNVIRRGAVGSYFSIGGPVSIPGAVYDFAARINMGIGFVPVASVGSQESFRLFCRPTGYPRPSYFGCLLDARLDGDTLALELPPQGVIPPQYYVSKPLGGHVATIGYQGAINWKDAHTPVTLDPFAGRYIGGRPTFVAGDPGFVAWTGGDVTLPARTGEVRISKVEDNNAEVVSDPIPLPSLPTGSALPDQDRIVDVQLAQLPLDPGRVPIVAVMSDLYAADLTASGTQGESHVSVYGAVADLRDVPFLRTDWVQLASLGKFVISS